MGSPMRGFRSISDLIGNNPRFDRDYEKWPDTRPSLRSGVSDDYDPRNYVGPSPDVRTRLGPKIEPIDGFGPNFGRRNFEPEDEFDEPSRWPAPRASLMGPGPFRDNIPPLGRLGFGPGPGPEQFGPFGPDRPCPERFGPFGPDGPGPERFGPFGPGGPMQFGHRGPGRFGPEPPYWEDPMDDSHYGRHSEWEVSGGIAYLNDHVPNIPNPNLYNPPTKSKKNKSKKKSDDSDEDIDEYVMENRPDDDDDEEEDEEVDLTDIPDEVKIQMGNNMCKLCAVKLNSQPQAKTHYEGKNHAKKLKQAIESYRKEGCVTTKIESAPKRRKITMDEASQLYCKCCDLSFTSADHATQHYLGRNHYRVINGLKPLKAGYYNRLTGKWQRMPPDPTVAVQMIATDEKARKGSQEKKGQFYCKICGISATSSDQLKQHFTGAKHKKAAAAQEEDLPRGRGSSYFDE